MALRVLIPGSGAEGFPRAPPQRARTPPPPDPLLLRARVDKIRQIRHDYTPRRSYLSPFAEPLSPVAHRSTLHSRGKQGPVTRDGRRRKNESMDDGGFFLPSKPCEFFAPQLLMMTDYI